MAKTTAKVEHRDYIPWGWIAIPFCRVSFNGEHANEMERKWNAITSARFKEYNTIVESGEARILEFESKIKNIQSSIQKPWYRPWYTIAEKQKLSQIQSIRSSIEEINLQIIENKKKRFYDSYECRRKIETLLNENDFYLTHTSSSGEECVTHTEIWTKD